MRKYIIQPGDTYSSIARKFNVSVQDLKNLNKYEDRKLPIGQSISIPESKKEVLPTKISDIDSPAESMAKENAIPNNPGLKSTTDALLKPLLTDKREEEQTPNLNPTNNVIVESGLNMVKEQKRKVIDVPKKFNLAAVLNTVTSNLEILRSYDYPRMRDERRKVETLNEIHNKWGSTANKKDSEIIAQAIDRRKTALGIKIKKENKNVDRLSIKVTKENYLQIYNGDKLFAEYKPNKYGMVELPHDGIIDTKLGPQNGFFSVDGKKLYCIYNYTGNDQWGKPEVIANLINSILEYRKYYPNDLIDIGDMRSNSDGKVKYEKGEHHGNAGAIDIRVLGEGGSFQGLFTDKRHDIERSKQFIKIMGEHEFSTVIVGRNIYSKLKNAKTDKIKVITDKPKVTVHDNHYHFHL